MSVFKVGDVYTWYNGKRKGVPFGEHKVTIVRANVNGGDEYIVELEGRPFSSYGGCILSEAELLGESEGADRMSSYHDLKQAAEREQHQREVRALRDEIEALKQERAALELERDNMLKERSGGWHDCPEWPDSEPFEYEAMGNALGEYVHISLSGMSADSRAAFVGRVSMLLYRYMGDSPHAQAMAIMKDLTGEPS